MSRGVGIDLGTTNSVVAVLEAGEPRPTPPLPQFLDQIAGRPGQALAGRRAVQACRIRRNSGCRTPLR